MTKRGLRRPPKAQKEKAQKGSSQPASPDAPFPVHEHIGRQLKSMFDDVVTQPIPDKLLELLEELERKRPKR